MLYKLSIKPTRLELLKLITLDKSRYKEIRVAVRPLPFRFNRGIIDSDGFFQQFVDIINDFLETYRQDITELYVALKENYFQVYEVIMPEYTEELVHWEISQYLTDDPSSYRFGSYYQQDSHKLQLVIARTRLIEYFQKVFKTIYGTINFTALGFDLKTTKTETIFIKANQDIVDFYRFGYTSTTNPASEIAPRTGGSFKKYLAILALSAAAVAAVVWININSSAGSSKTAIESTTETVAAPPPAPDSLPRTAAAAAESSKVAQSVQQAAATTPAATTTAAKTTASQDIYSLLALLAAEDIKTVIINRQVLLLETENPASAANISRKLQSAAPGLKPHNSGSKKTLLSCPLPENLQPAAANGRKNFDQLSASLKLSDKYNYRLFNNRANLEGLITGLQKNRTGFTHLVLAKRDGIYSLAIEFN